MRLFRTPKRILARDRYLSAAHEAAHAVVAQHCGLYPVTTFDEVEYPAVLLPDGSVVEVNNSTFADEAEWISHAMVERREADARRAAKTNNAA